MNYKIEQLLIGYVLYNMMNDPKIDIFDYLIRVMNYSCTDAAIIYSIMLNKNEN